MIAQYVDIILLLLVAVLVFTKLKTLLGTRPEETRSAKISDEQAARIFDLLVKEAKEQSDQTDKTAAAETTAADGEQNETDKTLAQIPGFDKETFLNGAKRAFEIIVTAFSKGDVETLEMLVNKNLFKKFQEIIASREAEGITSENDFIGFDKAEIISAKINKNNVAKIVVEFVSEQVNLLKNRLGEVIEGDENYIQNITDVWTFEKTLTSSNPNWLLVSTKK